MDDEEKTQKIEATYWVPPENRKMIVTLAVILLVVPVSFLAIMLILTFFEWGSAQEALLLAGRALGADRMKKPSAVFPEIGSFLRSVFFLSVIVLLLRPFRTAPISKFGMRAKRPAFDLSSALALLVMAALFMMAILGVAIPEAIQNIALVIVGYSFGRRHGLDDSTRKTWQSRGFRPFPKQW